MKKLITSVTPFTPKMNCSVLIKFILIISLCGVISKNALAQKDNSDVITKMPEKKSGIIYDAEKNTKTPPETFGPALIRNVPMDYATIQAAINASNNGDIVLIAAGTYREDITMNKYLKIRGANYGINPNTGIRGAETIIQPATSDPDPYSPTYVINFYIGSNGSGSIIDGITFDGDNPTLTSGVVINGADIDAAEGIAAYDGMSNLTISNNIFKNINYAGIDLDNYNNGGASTYDNFVIDNLFDNMNVNAAFGISVLIYDNCYTSITDNVMTRVRIGVQTGNYSQADLSTNHSISNNTIQSYRLGIFHNLAYTNATSFTISNNVITTVAGAPKNVGIEVASMQSSVGATVTDNNITGARYGYSLWNCPTTNTITVSGGILTNCNVGVFPNNYDGYNSNADPSIYAMTGITMTNCDTAIWIRDNNLNTNSATVALNINNATNIVNGTGIGLLIEGGDASVSFSAGDPIDFNTNLSKYIQLITNGSNVPAADINAQEVEFGGTKGNASTNSQLFAIEDKIDHKIDWNSVGFVNVKANNSYVTTNSFYPPNTTSASIQNSINLAVIGDTVNAGSGTYNEAITVNKAITLNGNGMGNTIFAPAILVCPPVVPIGIAITSSNVNVNNLTVSNYNYGITTSASTINLYNVESINNCLYGINTSNGTSGLTLLKCKLNNNIVGGWRAGTGDLISNILIDSSEVKGNGVGVNNGFGIFLAASTPAANTADNITIRNSDFSNNLKKGMYFEKLRDALIDNVVIDNSGIDVAYGFNNGIDINLKYDSYSNITIQNCSITNSGVMGTATDVNNPSAITVKARDDSPSYNSDPATLTGFTMKNCFISGPVNGLRFGEFNKTNNSPTGNTVIENNFGGAYSNKAIVNKTANTISVSCNWYGSPVPANVIALHSSGLNYIPFLTDGTDDQLAIPGFQIVPGSCNGMGPVKNITQVTSYPTIQLAVNAANNGDIIEVDPGTYNEQVLVNKEVTIKNSGAKPVVDFSGTPALVSGKLTLFEVTVPNVTIESIEFKVDLAKLGSAIIASAVNMNNLSVKNNDINPYRSGTPITYGLLNAININYGSHRINSSNPSNILAENNTISYNFYGTPNDPSDDAGFRSGFATDEGGGTFNLNTIQTVSQDIEARFGGAGDINITNNNINGGGVNLAEYNGGAGNINVTGNTFDGAFGNTYSSSLRLKNNQQVKTTVVSGNTFQNHNWGISLENYRAVTIDNNTFTPAANSTVFRHITINTKLLNTSSATVTQTAIDGTFTNNTFNQSGTPGGTGMAFYNHDSDNDTYGTFTIGSSGNENDFNSGIALFIALDPSTGPSWPSAFPENNLDPSAITSMACWDQDLNIEYNNYDVGAGLQLPSAMDYTQRTALETNLYHKPDNSCLGNLSFFMPVHNLTQNTYFMNIQPAINAANPLDVIECEEYTFNERVTIDKSLTLQGVNKTNCVIDGTGLGIGKGIQINSGITNVTIKRLTVQYFKGSGGNADAGVYAIGGNNNLYLESVKIQNDSGGSGFYANGPVNTVTLDSVTASGHPNVAGATRGIVIWNGLKENITIKNCEVFQNNCCGIELQDGQASGVTFENNNIHDNGDNGIGIVGLQGPGENLIKGNTLLNNGRFGIEIKNPNGSGLTTGPGRIVVENNNVSRSIPIGSELRDIAGIAAFRRGVLAGNVDIPTGVVIQNNTVSGYLQGSTSDGFGIVVEGMNHTVSGNTVSGCDVGIQRQAGHLPYPTDGDQSNLADTYFGRGNSPQTCGVILTGNILTNTLNTRDVGASAGGYVTNLNTTLIYCSIQAAIDDPLTLNSHVIEIGAGTYYERVVVSKELTLQGTDKVNCILDGTGLGIGKGIQINSGITNVTIKRLTVQYFKGSGGNADAGVYAIGGNNNLYLESVKIQNDSGGSGFYANGPVNTVTLDSVTASGHPNVAGATRGIVIWNGLKENITIKNCEVFQNNCCGIELQDGQASGVTFENNNIHDNGDNGIGIVGLQGPGENLIKGNTLLNNGRFGIEIKNPNGSGLTTGPGRIVVENNNVSRSIPIGSELRDIVGIAAFRRGVLAGNVDIPTGVVIQNNIVSDYVQPSTSDGFGIVVEGMNHTVSGNTVSGCDVGIQRQAGHLPAPPADGDQSNLADTYFGRGNATQTCGIILSGNILTNTINTRDVGAGTGIVKNFNTNEIFCTIQAAIDDAQTVNGNIIEVEPGTYNEQVLVNKQLVIKGVGATKPVVDFTGTVSGKPTIFDVSVPNVTLENMRIRVDMTKLNSAVIASATNIDNLNINTDSIEAYGSSNAATTGSYGNRNAISINYSGPINYLAATGGVNNVSVQGNVISGVLNDGFGVSRYFRSGVSMDEGGGVFNNNTIQTINHDLLARFGRNGNIEFKNNNFNGGGIEMADMNPAAGDMIVSDNIFDATFANSSASGSAVLRLKNNYNSKTTLVNRNNIFNHKWGVSLENYNSVTLDSNTFTPQANSTIFHHVTINTKSISSNSASILQVTIGAVLTRNTFNYSGTTGGTALSFHNHDNDAASFGTFTIGSPGNENIFNTGIQNFVYLDPQTGPSNGTLFPYYDSLIGVGAGAITTKACWSTDENIENNLFDVGAGLQLPSAMNYTQRSALETNLYHKPDNSCLGNLSFFMPVHNLTQNTYFMNIQPAVNAAVSGDIIECEEYTYNERVTIDKPLTIQGVNKTNCIVDGTGLGIGKGIQINSGITNVTIKRLTVQYFKGSGGNADAGVYAIGGNNNLYLESVKIQNDSGGSGFYANGPVNTVTLDSVTSSGHPNVAGVTRGIVIWNGLKENITIKNCEVFQNNCCGIELQDGQASGVTIENNNVHDNGDNGIGLMGLQGPGENLIRGNTLLNNGRFGIEMKNPNGSGLTTGPGRIVVENNNVSRNTGIIDTRDIAGISAYRRDVGAGNVEIPTGVVIQNNIVSDYIQTSVSDGFGIVVEGMNHTVSGNTVSGCDVGIQRQAGHLPAPPVNGDQSNLADTYFGRGNTTQTCGVTLSGNILTNTANTRDVTITGEGVVENITSGKSFCTIQTAIDDSQTQNGDVLDIDSANYNESVVVSKEVTLLGSGGNTSSRPTVEGVAGQTISVTAPNVTINNLIVKFNQGSVNTGIKAAVSGSFNNLTVKNSCVFGTGTTGAPVFASYGLQLGTFGGVNYDQVNLDSNEIKHTGTSPLGRGVKTFNCYGDWKRSSITGFYSIQSGDIQGGLLNITNDSLRGETEINSTGAGNHTFSNNICDVSNAYGPGTDFALLELKNLSSGGSNLLISGNTFSNYVNFGIFSGRSNNVTIDNNTFTPDPASVVFRSIRVDTKQRTTAPQTAFASGADIIKNTFNGNVAVGQAGVSVELANSDNISSIGTVTLGGPGNENNFNTNVSKFISLNNETASTSGDPVWTGTYVSTKGKVTANVNGVNNNYNAGAGLQLPSAMLLTNLFMLEDKIQHKIDDFGIGFVLVKANNDYVTVNSFVSPETTTPSVQRGIDAASAGFTVNVDAGSFTEQLEVNKDLTIDGQGSTLTNIISPNVLALSYTTSGVNKPVIYVHDAADVVIKDLTVDGAGKGNANNRFQGIAYRNAGGTLRNCDIKAVRNTPIDGVQAGVGLYAYADDGNARKLIVIKNNIFDFQKNATVFAGADLTAKIDSNTITGAGAINFTAQNGIQLSTGAAGSIRYNTISNLSYTPSTFVASGILLYQSSGPDTTSNNILTACQMGIYYFDVGGVIRENTVSATAANTGTVTYYGINADPGASPRVKIQPVDVQEFAGKGKVNLSNSSAFINTSIFRNTVTSDGTNGIGIEMDALGTQTLNVSVLENKVNGWNTAVVFYKDGGATLNGTVNDNDLSNNTNALNNLTGVLQNCTCNWYGTIVPATISSKISGTVNSSPYLTNGTDFNAAPGFQPVPGSCNGILAATLNIKVIQEGFYNTGTQTLNKKDTVRAYLHLDFFPYSVLDSSISTVDSVTFTGSFSFSTPSGNYYIVVKHRNTIETWSKSGGEAFTAGATMNYDFTDAVTKAYQNNMVQVDNAPVRFAVYSGDVNQDGIVDASDVGSDENDATNSASGYVSTDVTGDDFVDASDLSIVENNKTLGIIVKKP